MKLPDDSIINDEGDLVYISVERFLREICEGNNCFLCGKSYEEGRTKEHIIPNWVLRKFGLHDKLVTLPNETRLRYGAYIVPCCGPCNGKLSKDIETPLSSLISKGFGAVAEYVQKNGPEKLFVWMCLIFIKTHLKDESLRMDRDFSKSGSSIACELGYDREIFHHTYCLARSPYTKALIQEYALGSFLLFPVDENGAREQFDFIDLSDALTFGIVIGDVGMISVFGDAGAILDALQDNIIRRLNGALNHNQFRELVSHFACCRVQLKDNPKFISVYDGEKSLILCSTPGFSAEYEDYDPLVLGSFMERLIWPRISHVAPEEYKEKLRSGQITYLFNENGEFRDHAS